MRKTEVSLGLVTAGIGLYIILISLNAIPVADERFGVSRWIAALAGATFLVGGGLVALIRAGILEAGRLRQKAAWGPRVREALTILLLGLFAAIGNGLAFMPGEGRLEWSVSLPFITVSGPAAYALDRVGFGVGAAILDIILILAVLDFAKRGRSKAVEP